MIGAGRRWLQRNGPLLVGDVAVLVAVLSLGIARHHGVAGLLNPTRVIEILTPFLLAWIVVAPLVGAYDERIPADRWRSVERSLGAWIGATIIGAGIRATPVFPGGATPVFVAVVAASGGVAIALWRLLIAEVTS